MLGTVLCSALHRHIHRASVGVNINWCVVLEVYCLFIMFAYCILDQTGRMSCIPVFMSMYVPHLTRNLQGLEGSQKHLRNRNVLDGKTEHFENPPLRRIFLFLLFMGKIVSVTKLNNNRQIDNSLNHVGTLRIGYVGETVDSVEI